MSETITCPYCQHQAEHEILKDAGDFECDECGELFSYDVHITVTTRKKVWP
jgi:uncharacterized Zn finger protein